MKQFNHYLNEVDIPEKDLDDLIMKTFSIVNDDVKNNLKFERDIKQGNLHVNASNCSWEEMGERKCTQN